MKLRAVIMPNHCQECNSSKSGEYYDNHESLTFQAKPTDNTTKANKLKLLLLSSFVIYSDNDKDNTISIALMYLKKTLILNKC